MEELNGHEVCPTYMYRWTLLKLGSYGLYGASETPPKRFRRSERLGR